MLVYYVLCLFGMFYDLRFYLSVMRKIWDYFYLKMISCLFKIWFICVCSEKLFGLFNEYFEWFCSRTVSYDVKCDRVCEILFFSFDLAVELNFADVHLEQTRRSQIIIIVQSNCDQAADFKDNNCTHHHRFWRGEAKRLRWVDPNHQFSNYNCSFTLERFCWRRLYSCRLLRIRKPLWLQ